MKTKLLYLFVSVLVAGLLAGSLFVPNLLAQATTLSPEAQTTPFPWRATLAPIRETLAALPAQDFSYLEILLKREKLALGNQQVRLSLAHQVSAATQAYIDSQKEAGKDTSRLEASLAAFNQALSEAETYHAAAGSLLENPAGFDSNGQVVDREQARQTVREAGQALRRAHRTITAATLDLRLAFREYRADNRQQ